MQTNSLPKEKTLSVGISNLSILRATLSSLTPTLTDGKEQIESFKDPKELYRYRKALESFSNGIFKRLVFSENQPRDKARLPKQT